MPRHLSLNSKSMPCQSYFPLVNLFMVCGVDHPLLKRYSDFRVESFSRSKFFVGFFFFPTCHGLLSCFIFTDPVSDSAPGPMNASMKETLQRLTRVGIDLASLCFSFFSSFFLFAIS